MTINQTYFLIVLVSASIFIAGWFSYLIYQFFASLKRYRELNKHGRLNPFIHGEWVNSGNLRQKQQPKDLFDDYKAKPEWEDHFKETNLGDHLNGYDDGDEK